MDQRILIAQLNVEHYRRMLVSEHADAKRLTIIRLLAEEEAKLIALRRTEGDVKHLLDTVSRQATDLFDRERSEKDRGDSKARLAAMLNHIPFAIGLTDHTGNWIMANIAMRQFAPRQALARDPQRNRRCRSIDPEGRPLSPTNWPSARALRGETVNPGIEFIYCADEGQKVRCRVAAVPVRYGDGDLAGAVVVVEELETLVSDRAC
jgi:PAS domain-containing protein